MVRRAVGPDRPAAPKSSTSLEPGPGTPPAMPSAMTAPRQRLRGSTYLVTRRTSQRQFFLRPSEHTNQTFAFLLAVATQLYGVQLHAYCVLSNHCYGVTCQHA